MTQQRLNHRIHQEKTDALDLNSIAKDLLKKMFHLIKIYLMNFKSFSVCYVNISVAVQKRIYSSKFKLFFSCPPGVSASYFLLPLQWNRKVKILAPPRHDISLYGTIAMLQYL